MIKTKDVVMRPVGRPVSGKKASGLKKRTTSSSRKGRVAAPPIELPEVTVGMDAPMVDGVSVAGAKTSFMLRIPTTMVGRLEKARVLLGKRSRNEVIMALLDHALRAEGAK